MGIVVVCGTIDARKTDVPPRIPRERSWPLAVAGLARPDTLMFLWHPLPPSEVVLLPALVRDTRSTGVTYLLRGLEASESAPLRLGGDTFRFHPAQREPVCFLLSVIDEGLPGIWASLFLGRWSSSPLRRESPLGIPLRWRAAKNERSTYENDECKTDSCKTKNRPLSFADYESSALLRQGRRARWR